MKIKSRLLGLLFIVNGGVNAQRFELFATRYIKDLFTPETDKIYGLINQLAL